MLVADGATFLGVLPDDLPLLATFFFVLLVTAVLVSALRVGFRAAAVLLVIEPPLSPYLRAVNALAPAEFATLAAVGFDSVDTRCCCMSFLFFFVNALAASVASHTLATILSCSCDSAATVCCALMK